DAAAEIAETGEVALVGEGLLVELEDAAGADHVGAVDQALTPFGLHQRALLAGDHRRYGEVVVWREREVVRRRDAEAVDRARVIGRDQEAGLALRARIG